MKPKNTPWNWVSVVGVLKLPAQWLLRLRHNPFYDYQEQRVLNWIDSANDRDDRSR